MVGVVALLALLAVGALLVLGRANDAASSEAAFWEWFAENEAQFARVVDSGDSKQIGDLCTSVINPQLHKTQPGIVCVIGYGDGRREIVLSADGVSDLFPAVTSLVEAAPVLEGWSVTAFRPPTPYDESTQVRFKGQTLRVSDLGFRELGQHEGRTRIVLHVVGLTPENREDRGGAAILLLDHICGEYDAVAGLEILSLEAYGNVPAGQEAVRPIRELSALLRRGNK